MGGYGRKGLPIARESFMITKIRFTTGVGAGPDIRKGTASVMAKKGQYKVPKNDAFLMKFALASATIISFIVAIFTFMREWTADMMTLHLRIGGKLFIICFLTAFSASSLYYFFPNKFTEWLRYHRKYFGLCAVVIMFWHFLVIALKVSVDWGFAVRELTPGEVIPSIVGLFFLGGMGITSTAKMHERLGHERWERLHLYGGNLFLANLFFGTIDGFELWDIPLFLATVIIILLRAGRALDIKLKKDKVPWRSFLPPVAVGYIICAVIVQFTVPTGLEEEQPVVQLPSGPMYRTAFPKEDIFPAQAYLPLRVGNVWTYRVTRDNNQTQKISYDVRAGQVIARKPRYRVHISDDLYMDIIQDNYGVRVVRDMHGEETWRFDPPGVELPHLALGQQLTFPINIHEESARSGDKQELKGYAEFELAAIEGVTVPAGTFPDCLKVKYARRIGYPGGSYDHIKGTAWYARNTGKVKDQRVIERYEAKPDTSVRTEELMELTDSVVAKP